MSDCGFTSGHHGDLLTFGKFCTFAVRIGETSHATSYHLEDIHGNENDRLH